MKFQLTQNAKTYLAKKKTTELTIEQYVPRMCCGSGRASLVCYIGPPKEKHLPYERTSLEGYTVYIDPVLDFRGHIVTISTEQYLLMENLTATAQEE